MDIRLYNIKALKQAKNAFFLFFNIISCQQLFDLKYTGIKSNEQHLRWKVYHNFNKKNTLLKISDPLDKDTIRYETHCITMVICR